MNSSSHVPVGYKQTEVGVIPEDWDLCLIQKLIDEKIIIDHLDGNHGELSTVLYVKYLNLVSAADFNF